MPPIMWLMVALFAGFWIVQWWKNAREARERARVDAEAGARARAEGEQRDEDEHEFRKSATLVRARVVSAHQLGRVNLEPNICLTLAIESPDGAYEVEVTQPIEPTELHRFGKGSMVDVYVDPKNREHVALCDPEIAAIHRDTEESMARADRLLRERE